MNIAAWIGVVAVLVAPLVAVQVSVYLQRRQERRDRKLQVFKTLMATRASGLAREHVQALNMIDIEFYGTDRRSKAVLNAWKAYLDHLNSGGTATEVWSQKREDLLVDLLYEMATHLGYEFDKTYIRRTSYFPHGYGDLELDQLEMRKAFLGILRGERFVPVWVGGPQAEASPADQSPSGESNPALPPGAT